MTLYQQLEKKVNSNELTWETILMEIHQIKRMNNLPPIIPTQQKDSNEQDLGSIASHFPSPLSLILRKELYENLKPVSKRLAEVIFSLKNQSSLCDKGKMRKEGRKNGLKRKEILMAERDLRVYAESIACYE